MHRLIGSFIVTEVFVQYSIIWQVIVYSFKKLDLKPAIINQLINFAGLRFQADNSFRKPEISPCQSKKFKLTSVVINYYLVSS